MASDTHGAHGTRKPITSLGDGAAICLTGALRTMLAMPVRRTYQQHVVGPLAQHFHVVHTHAAIVLPSPATDELRHEIAEAYTTKSLEFLTSEESMAPFSNPLKQQQCRIDHQSRWSNAHGDASVLAQWSAIGRCYDNVERVERESRSQYAWLLRLRTDQTFFADVPLFASDGTMLAMTDAVFVPSHGMTGDPAYRCMNDQSFLCPRHLCRPYFRLLELWTSAYCNASSSSTVGSIFATGVRTPHGVDGPPEEPYVLPLPPRGGDGPLAARLTAQWYLFARYSLASTAGKPCNANDATEHCCGIIREVAWPYSIARHDARGGRRTLECTTRLASYSALRPTSKDFRQRPTFWRNTSVLLAACRSLEREWLSAEQVEEQQKSSNAERSMAKAALRRLQGAVPLPGPDLSLSSGGDQKGSSGHHGAETQTGLAKWDVNESSASRARVARYCATMESLTPTSTDMKFSSSNRSSSAGSLKHEIYGNKFCNWLAGPSLMGISHRPRGSGHGSGGIGADMRTIGTAAAPAALILGVHLTNTSTKYFPLFGKDADLHSAVDKFVKSPAVVAGLANGTLRLHVVHDSPLGTHQYKGVSLHHLTPTTDTARRHVLPAQDARWELYGRLLATLRPDPRTCVFMVDFKDVVLLRSSLDRLCASADENAEVVADGPGRQESLQRVEPSSLFVGSDMCMSDSARKFLRHQLNMSGFQPSAELRRILAARKQPYLHNVGILGGRLPVVERMRRQLESGTKAHYAGRPIDEAPRYVVDSVLLNDLLLRSAHAPAQLVGGWPRGFVNLPMAGELCQPPKFNPYCNAARFRNCRARNLLGAMAPHYYFGHKLSCGGVLDCQASWGDA